MERWGKTVGFSGILALLWSLLAAQAALPREIAQEGPLLLPGDSPPAAVLGLGSVESSLAIAVTRDGKLAAAAFPDPDRPKISLIRLASAEETREAEVRGTVQALRFDDGGGLLLAIAHRLGRKRVLEAYLLVMDTVTLKARRSVSLPETARSLDLWDAGSSVLVACKNQVRTVVLPQMRTGPLFWIEGENRAVASLPGGDLMLLGQDGKILLVNLSDPQDRDSMPVREEVSVPGAVEDLAAAPDGRGALARLEDGTTFTVRLDPLRIDRKGTSDAIAWLGRPPSRPSPLREATPAAPDLPEPPIVAEIRPEAPPPEQEIEPAVAEAEPSEHEHEPAPVEQVEERAQEKRPVDSPLGEMEGKVTGAAVSGSVSVVLLGPDNILKEAARVAPDPDGSWEALGLPPGRYRVVLDGGGKRVLVTRPRFLLVRVEAGSRVRTEELRILHEM